MTSKAKVSSAGFSVRAYTGDAKTLLAFNLPNRQAAKDLAGFTIECKPGSSKSYYIQNSLQFATPGDHVQDPKEPPNSSINAPFHKFRWVHIPGSVHQGIKPFFGPYTYTVTPRYFENRSLTALDPTLSVSITVDVKPFEKKRLSVGFTRGFTQSQAFVNHFGPKVRIHPKEKSLTFDTSEIAGKNANGDEYTYEEEYQWLGYTARERIFELVNKVVDSKSLKLDMFAYDLNEPDLVELLLKLAKQGRVRVILDNAALHHEKKGGKPEDQFEKAFKKAAKGDADILRGKFGRYSHDKVFVVHDKSGPLKVLTGSTNFSVTGLYVNSNHVLIYDDRKVAGKYAELFDTVWSEGATRAAFLKSPLSTDAFKAPASVPQTSITFAPHDEEVAQGILDEVVARIEKEGKQPKKQGSVLFAVMELDNGVSPVYTALKKVHENEKIFSFGISDNPGGIELYSPGRKRGVLVTGKPTSTRLPPPFNQVPGVGLGHQVHHKLVVCGFRGPDPTVFCGSSNLALGGEKSNGDNLLEIHDEDVATVFAIEALTLVDHFQFLNRSSTAPNGSKSKSTKTASKKDLATSSGWYLGVTDKWVESYFDRSDLHCVDRELFA